MIRPGTIRRSVLAVLGVCVLVGIIQGVVWAFTAPGIPYKVLADGRFGALPTTSTYHFVDVALFALSGMVIGILLAVGAWHLRAARGWQMILALVGGSLLGGIIAWVVGGAMTIESAAVAPTTGTLLVVLAQPAMAAAIYTFLVAWNGRPDLGTGVDQSADVDDSPVVDDGAVVDESVGGWPEGGERVGHP